MSKSPSRSASADAHVPPNTDAVANVPGTAAFAKFIGVLQLIADAPGELGIAELCERSRLPRATVYRIVAALRVQGLVQGTGHFALGPRLISLASRSWAMFDLRSLARDDLRDLRDRTGETVHLAVPSAKEMVYIDKLESPQTVRMTSRIGTRVTLHASSVGKAYLAALTPAECGTLLEDVSFRRMTPHTITRRKELDAELARTRKRGYAVDREETEPEILCLGAAVRNRAGRPIAGISVSVPKYRFDRAAETRYPRLIVQCAERISEKHALSESPLSE